MSHTRGKPRQIVGATRLLGALAVLAVAAAAFNATSDGALAANHCTRYAPVVFQPDHDCTVAGPIASALYKTPSTALRDSNYYRMIQATNFCWQLTYEPDAGNGASGCGGTYALIQGAAGYRKAVCSFQVFASVYGHCTTWWHD